MPLSRRLLLALSETPWLRAHAPRWWFVKRAATRFMPGDTLDEALTAAEALHEQGLDVVFTELGENVTDIAQADTRNGPLRRCAGQNQPQRPEL
jgi:hypothetical protein